MFQIPPEKIPPEKIIAWRVIQWVYKAIQRQRVRSLRVIDTKSSLHSLVVCTVAQSIWNHQYIIHFLSVTCGGTMSMSAARQSFTAARNQHIRLHWCRIERCTGKIELRFLVFNDENNSFSCKWWSFACAMSTYVHKIQAKLLASWQVKPEVTPLDRLWCLGQEYWTTPCIYRILFYPFCCCSWNRMLILFTGILTSMEI